MKYAFRSQNKGIGALEDLFKKYNWHFLGSGIDASVAEHPNKKYVLKVFHSNSRYRHFVDLVHKHENNPHFPKFYGRIKPVPQFPQYSFIRMEKLNKIESAYTLFSLFLPEMLYLNIESRKYGINLDMDADLQTSIYNRYKRKLNTEYLSKPIVWEFVPKPDSEWQQATKLVCAVVNSFQNEGFLDIHHNNLMIRNFTLVYLDPFV